MEVLERVERLDGCKGLGAGKLQAWTPIRSHWCGLGMPVAKKDKFHTCGGPRRRPCLGQGRGRRIIWCYMLLRHAWSSSSPENVGLWNERALLLWNDNVVCYFWTRPVVSMIFLSFGLRTSWICKCSAEVLSIISLITRIVLRPGLFCAVVHVSCLHRDRLMHR